MFVNCRLPAKISNVSLSTKHLTFLFGLKTLSPPKADDVASMLNISLKAFLFVPVSGNFIVLL